MESNRLKINQKSLHANPMVFNLLQGMMNNNDQLSKQFQCISNHIKLQNDNLALFFKSAFTMQDIANLDSKITSKTYNKSSIKKLALAGKMNKLAKKDQLGNNVSDTSTMMGATNALKRKDPPVDQANSTSTEQPAQQSSKKQTSDDKRNSTLLTEQQCTSNLSKGPNNVQTQVNGNSGASGNNSNVASDDLDQLDVPVINQMSDFMMNPVMQPFDSGSNINRVNFSNMAHVHTIKNAHNVNNVQAALDKREYTLLKTNPSIWRHATRTEIDSLLENKRDNVIGKGKADDSKEKKKVEVKSAYTVADITIDYNPQVVENKEPCKLGLNLPANSKWRPGSLKVFGCVKNYCTTEISKRTKLIEDLISKRWDVEKLELMQSKSITAKSLMNKNTKTFTKQFKCFELALEKVTEDAGNRRQLILIQKLKAEVAFLQSRIKEERNNFCVLMEIAIQDLLTEMPKYLHNKIAMNTLSLCIEKYDRAMSSAILKSQAEISKKRRFEKEKADKKLKEALSITEKPGIAIGQLIDIKIQLALKSFSSTVLKALAATNNSSDIYRKAAGTFFTDYEKQAAEYRNRPDKEHKAPEEKETPEHLAFQLAKVVSKVLSKSIDSICKNKSGNFPVASKKEKFKSNSNSSQPNKESKKKSEKKNKNGRNFSRGRSSSKSRKKKSTSRSRSRSKNSRSRSRSRSSNFSNQRGRSRSRSRTPNGNRGWNNSGKPKSSYRSWSRGSRNKSSQNYNKSAGNKKNYHFVSNWKKPYTNSKK